MVGTGMMIRLKEYGFVRSGMNPIYVMHALEVVLISKISICCIPIFELIG